MRKCSFFLVLNHLGRPCSSLSLAKAERRKRGTDGGNLAERELRNSFKT